MNTLYYIGEPVAENGGHAKIHGIRDTVGRDVARLRVCRHDGRTIYQIIDARANGILSTNNGWQRLEADTQTRALELLSLHESNDTAHSRMNDAAESPRAVLSAVADEWGYYVEVVNAIYPGDDIIFVHRQEVAGYGIHREADVFSIMRGRVIAKCRRRPRANGDEYAIIPDGRESDDERRISAEQIFQAGTYAKPRYTKDAAASLWETA